MKTSRFTTEQIIGSLQEHAAGGRTLSFRASEH